MDFQRSYRCRQNCRGYHRAAKSSTVHCASTISQLRCSTSANSALICCDRNLLIHICHDSLWDLFWLLLDDFVTNLPHSLLIDYLWYVDRDLRSQQLRNLHNLLNRLRIDTWDWLFHDLGIWTQHLRNDVHMLNLWHLHWSFMLESR